MIAGAELVNARHPARVAERTENFPADLQRHAEVNLGAELTVSAVGAPVGLRQAFDRQQIIAPQRFGADSFFRIAAEADGHGGVRRVRERDAVASVRDFGDDASFQSELLDAPPQQPLQSLRVS